MKGLTFWRIVAMVHLAFAFVHDALGKPIKSLLPLGIAIIVSIWEQTDYLKSEDGRED
jgi:hypothetical protein